MKNGAQTHWNILNVEFCPSSPVCFHVHMFSVDDVSGWCFLWAAHEHSWFSFQLQSCVSYTSCHQKWDVMMGESAGVTLDISRVLTFFQIGILAFSWLMQCWIACCPSCRWGDEIAITTLAWPTSTHLREKLHLLISSKQFTTDQNRPSSAAAKPVAAT